MNRFLSSLTAILIAPLAGAHGAELSLTSPLDYQVVQRSSPGRGLLRIAGELSEDVPADAAVQVRVMSDGLQLPWMQVNSVKGRKVIASYEAPAGGWLKMEVQVVHGGKQLALVGTEPGAEFEFSFEGTGCGLFIASGPDAGQIGISIGGPNPIVERDFNVAGLHIRADRITAWDNDVLQPKGSPEAAELKAKGIWNRKFFYAKTEKLQIAPDVWHNLAVELRGKELRVTLDGKPALTYTTLCGDVPKNDIGLQPGGKSKTPVASWFDDIRIEPLHAAKQTPQ